MTPHPSALLALVVDDVEDVRELFGEYLRRRGYAVLEASDGQQAVSLGITRQPDLIVMDLAMPIMDGWTATRILKSDARTCSIPIIVVTGNAIATDMAAATAAGANAVLTKPCTLKGLHGAIDLVQAAVASARTA